ncbi:MAG TPA: hypothetical protein VK040_04010 [Balneolaceae bacterium]|nr:hypothetical protein [Balneolaceae bacterium]
MPANRPLHLLQESGRFELTPSLAVENPGIVPQGLTPGISG